MVYQEFHALVVEHAKRIKARKADDWRRPVDRPDPSAPR